MYKLFLKRIIDVIISLLIVILTLPLLIIISILLVYYNKGNLFFRQKRVGLREKLFTLYKFKTMTDEVDENGVLLPNELRITPIGSFMRNTSIDELPQLINILIGDMSLIGPRPLPVRYLDLYTDEQKKRHNVRPGITGWAQVNGRNSISWKEKFALDVWYSEHISFLLDIKILFMTIYKVLKISDINSGSKIGAERFNGYN